MKVCAPHLPKITRDEVNISGLRAIADACYNLGIMENPNVTINKEALAEFCRRHYIRRLAIFGSALRSDFSEQSDVDVLVEFEPGHTPGFGFFDIEDQLSSMFGRKVDLNTPNFLSTYFRDRVMAEAEVQYSGE